MPSFYIINNFNSKNKHNFLFLGDLSANNSYLLRKNQQQLKYKFFKKLKNGANFIEPTFCNDANFYFKLLHFKNLFYIREHF